jgi:hypothetical protein
LQGNNWRGKNFKKFHSKIEKYPNKKESHKFFLREVINYSFSQRQTAEL